MPAEAPTDISEKIETLWIEVEPVLTYKITPNLKKLMTDDVVLLGDKTVLSSYDDLVICDAEGNEQDDGKFRRHPMNAQLRKHLDQPGRLQPGLSYPEFHIKDGEAVPLGFSIIDGEEGGTDYASRSGLYSHVMDCRTPEMGEAIFKGVTADEMRNMGLILAYSQLKRLDTPSTADQTNAELIRGFVERLETFPDAKLEHLLAKHVD